MRLYMISDLEVRVQLVLVSFALSVNGSDVSHKSFRRYLRKLDLAKLDWSTLVAAELIAGGLIRVHEFDSSLARAVASPLTYTSHAHSGLQHRSVRGELSTRLHCQSSRDSVQGSTELQKLNRMLY
jgi:hypothetical protein